MKKHLKSIISMLLAVVLFTTAFPLNAAAAEKLSIDIEHDYYGTAFVTLTAGDSDNYITYTTDGSVPKSNSEKYKDEFAVYEKTTLRVAEFTAEGTKVKGLKTTVNVKTAPVTFKVKQLGGKAEVTMSCMTEGAEIRYTTDGTKPSKESELYTEKIILTEKTKIRARAYKDDFKTTTTYLKTVNISDEADEEAVVPKKTDDDKDDDDKEESASTVSEKIYASEKISYKVTYLDNGTTRVTLIPAKSGYTLRYTTDGSTPTYKTGKKCKSYVLVDEPTILRVRQYNSKGKCMGSIKLNIKIKCADVIFNCVSMDTGIREIEMTCSTPGATIYYTTNGTSPKSGDGRIYTEPVFTSEIADIMAYAAKDGYKDGSVAWEIAGNIGMELKNFDFNDYQFALGLETLNDYRRANGLSELVLDEDLTKAANLRALEVSVLYSSTRPSGTNYTTAMGYYGVNAVFSAEYIDKHHDNAREFIDDILSNKANVNRILTNAYDYTKIGIGYYKTRTTTYWVLLMITE